MQIYTFINLIDEVERRWKFVKSLKHCNTCFALNIFYNFTCNEDRDFYLDINICQIFDTSSIIGMNHYHTTSLLSQFIVNL